MGVNELRQFLVAVNKAGYATGKSREWTKEKDGSTTIAYKQGEWKSHDNFFGGEPYGGRMVVYCQDKPVWIMVYYGWVVEGVKPDLVYPVLRAALKLMPEKYPFRGPKKYLKGKFVYTNKYAGKLERFAGEEKITSGKKLVYKANYWGGLVDQRRGT